MTYAGLSKVNGGTERVPGAVRESLQESYERVRELRIAIQALMCYTVSSVEFKENIPIRAEVAQR